MVAKVGADIKVGNKTGYEKDMWRLQRDMNRLCKWAKIWQIM